MKFIKGFLVFVALMVLIGSCSSSKEESPPVTGKPTEPEPVQEAQQLPVGEDDYVALLLEILEDNFEESADVAVDRENKMFLITPTDQDLADSLVFIMAGDEEIKDIFQSIVISQQELSRSVSEVLPGYAVCLVNPSNHDLFLIVTMNGAVIYNFMDEL